MTDQRSLRAQLGLDAASEGDPRGVAVFLDFVQREIYSIVCLSGAPKDIRDRLIELQQHTERAREYAAGFAAGCSALDDENPDAKNKGEAR